MKLFRKFVKPIKISGFSLMIVCVLFPQAESRKETSEKTEIRVGYISTLFSGIAQRDAEAAIDVWAQKFIEANNMNYKATGIVYDDLVSVVQAISDGEVDIVSLNALEFLSVRENVDFEPTLMAARGNSIKEKLILLTWKDTGSDGLGHLKSKKLKILKGIHGQMGIIWLNTVLAKEKLPECQEFFKTIETVEKSSSAMLPVFFKQADACIVTRTSFDSAVELNPQIGRILKIGASSPGFALHIMCLRRNLGAEHKENILKSIKKLENDPAGGQILMLFSIKKMHIFDPELLKPVEKIVDEYHRLKSLRQRTGEN